MTTDLKNATNEFTPGDDALWAARDVHALTKVSRGTLAGLIANHGFPPPIRFSQRCHRWRASDVRAWLRTQSGATA
jgi:predicted DNA-binding transcriptional regulator AlpA